MEARNPERQWMVSWMGGDEALVAEKAHFGSSRIQRWFGREWSTKG